MIQLTPTQKRILDYIVHYIERKQLPPSFREIMHQFNYSSLGTVHKHIDSLRKKGVLSQEKKIVPSSSIENKIEESDGDPLLNPMGFIQLPLIGYIRAGYPIETFSKSINLSVPASYAPNPEQSYVLQVRGDALQEEQIVEGDLLIVEAKSTARPGDLVIVLVNHHDTLIKRYYPDDRYVRLEALNSSVRPMILRKDNLEIQGMLTGLLRTYT